jgi:ADP-ribosylglycohydrolase
MDKLKKAQGCLLGLAVGDALGAPTEGMTPQQIGDKFGQVTDFISDDQKGTDDTEFALFNALLLLEHGLGITSEIIGRAWLDKIYSKSSAYKGAGFSEVIALNNLNNGQLPPASGKHAHSWSDGLAMRVAPFGIVAAGNPHLAGELTDIDGCVSNTGEGIISGQAVAAAIAVAMITENMDNVLYGVYGVIPDDSWTARAIKEGIKIGREAESLPHALDSLYKALVCEYYFWPDIAPEAIGLAFGIIAATDGQFEEAVLAGVNIGRDSDTIAAIVGGILGALHGIDIIRPDWVQRVNIVNGTCIKDIKNINMLEIASQLSAII